MTSWLRRIRGAVGMGIVWAITWALGGMLIAASSLIIPGFPTETLTRIFDAPAPALAIPGFIGGVLFSVVLGVAARRRRFDELSLRAVAGWGAIGGLLLSLVPVAMGSVGLATINIRDPLAWQVAVSLLLTVLSGASAAGALTLARLGAKRDQEHASLT